MFEEYRYDTFGRRALLRSRARGRSQTRGTCTASICKAALERFSWDGDQLLETRIPGDSGRTNTQLDVYTSSVKERWLRAVLTADTTVNWHVRELGIAGRAAG